MGYQYVSAFSDQTLRIYSDHGYSTNKKSKFDLWKNFEFNKKGNGNLLNMVQINLNIHKAVILITIAIIRNFFQ